MRALVPVAICQVGVISIYINLRSLGSVFVRMLAITRARTWIASQSIGMNESRP